jgi:hypothetical protein
MNPREVWNFRFQQLEEYKRAHGHCNVPQKYGPCLELGRWVAKQRVVKRGNDLSFEREATLDWSIRYKSDWNLRFQQLVEYKKANGECNVSTKDIQNIELARWVGKQREAKNKSVLTEERERKLNSLGFAWSLKGCNNANWDVRFRQLMEYKEAVGDFSVPKIFIPNPPLGHWVQEQRQAKKSQRLIKERLEKLNSIGFDWGKRNQENWDASFDELLSYFQTHGDFNVLQCYPRNPLLARWVSEQRNEYDLKRRGEQTSLTPMREAKLDAIGFTWIVGGTEEEAPAECVSSASVRPEEAPSGTKIKSENNGVALLDASFLFPTACYRAT